MSTKVEMKKNEEEIVLKPMKGMACLISNIIATLAALVAFFYGVVLLAGGTSMVTMAVAFVIVGGLYGFIVGSIIFVGLKVLKPNEALVLTLFGRYYGTIKGEGFYWVNPFCSTVNPAAGAQKPSTAAKVTTAVASAEGLANMLYSNKKVSLKAMTLNNDRQKINDQLGNPIIIGTVVIWKVVNTAKAVFNVDNYKEYLSIQCDSALRNIVRLYPYDCVGTDFEESLQGSSMAVAEKLKEEIQEKVHVAGLEVIEARITHLAYAEEIAASMLQRQQASAVVAAKQLIVEGAVGIVETALKKLGENEVIHLDEERKAAMVSNLLVVLCGSKDIQPVVNSGTIY